MTRANSETPDDPQPVSFRTALMYWWRLGWISFGGPAGQIALMHRELVDQQRWISERRFLHALNYCMVLPGPEAQQLATYIGYLLHGTKGALAAGVLFVLPSLFILAALTWIYLVFGDVPAVQSILWAIKPAVVAIVLHAAWRIGTRSLKHPALWMISVAAFVAIFAFSAPFPLIILAAALLGMLGNRIMPQAFVTGGGHGTAKKGAAKNGSAKNIAHTPALIDDDTPTPAHAHFSRKRFIRIVVVFVMLWVLVLGALALAQGWQSTLAQMGWFFTKAALLTFGGAYAVLPYVTDGAVTTHGWLTLPQMMDGLALGETTPGPLIMIVAFVGFVGGWTHDAIGFALPWAGGIAGACVATFFTFLPSFLFILAGVPLVEATRQNIRISAPLLAITAAVVGVIANLALFFAGHVFWPHGIEGVFDWPALLISAGAFIALWKFEVSVVRVIAACAVPGLLGMAL